MTSREETQINTMKVTKKFLDDHSEKWSSIKAIVRYKNELDENLQAIAEKQKETVPSSKPITALKNETKEVAALKAAILAGAMAAYAAEMEDKVLEEVAGFTRASVFRLPDAEFRQPVDQLINTAREELRKEKVEGFDQEFRLSDQGVTDEQITELETTLDDYSELLGDPRRLQINIALRNKSISELVSGTYEMIQTKLDKSMLRFKLTDPTFYEGYERARVIVG